MLNLRLTTSEMFLSEILKSCQKFWGGKEENNHERNNAL